MPRRLRYLDPARMVGLPSEKAERDRFYAGARWRRLRARFLRKYPLCAECRRAGRIAEAEVVHHVIERLARPDLAYDPSNLLALCNACHTRLHKRNHESP